MAKKYLSSNPEILTVIASKKKVAAVGGIPVMSVEKIQPLCEDATDVLFAELQGKINKIVKKSANF